MKPDTKQYLFCCWWAFVALAIAVGAYILFLYEQ